MLGFRRGLRSDPRVQHEVPWCSITHVVRMGCLACMVFISTCHLSASYDPSSLSSIAMRQDHNNNLRTSPGRANRLTSPPCSRCDPPGFQTSRQSGIPWLPRLFCDRARGGGFLSGRRKLAQGVSESSSQGGGKKEEKKRARDMNVAELRDALLTEVTETFFSIMYT